jgi:hypothetical protein
MEYLSQAADASTTVIELHDSIRALLIWLALPARGIGYLTFSRFFTELSAGSRGVEWWRVHDSKEPMHLSEKTLGHCNKLFCYFNASYRKRPTAVEEIFLARRSGR